MGKKSSKQREIQLDFISSEMLTAKTREEKLSMILDRVKNNVIVVLEGALTPEEEAELIQTTMKNIDPERFHGIEFHRMDHKEKNIFDRIANFLTGKRSGLTIVGPTRMVESIKKEPDHISILAKVGG